MEFVPQKSGFLVWVYITGMTIPVELAPRPVRYYRHGQFCGTGIMANPVEPATSKSVCKMSAESKKAISDRFANRLETPHIPVKLEYTPDLSKLVTSIMSYELLNFIFPTSDVTMKNVAVFIILFIYLHGIPSLSRSDFLVALTLAFTAVFICGLFLAFLSDHSLPKFIVDQKVVFL